MLIVSILLFQIIQSPEIINPSEVKIGMEGFGLSTFQGVKIDTFNVKITGILPPSPTGSEIILAELKGDVVDEAGVLAGMSGSPVYLEGKLLGAVAYSWLFAKKPICGITPFIDMKRGRASSHSGFGGLTPIKPILNATGFPPSSIPLLDSLPGVFLFTSGLQGGMVDNPTPIAPGGVCGVTLVTGDGNISAMGTITAVNGDTIYAFGHSAFGTGISCLPLCEGMVSSYLPSYYSSFKFANPGNIIGTIVSDGVSGIKGILKRDPPMVNCRIRLNDVKRNYRITSMKSFLPGLTSFLLFANWIEEIGVYNPITLKGSIMLYTNQGNVSFSSVMSGEYLHMDIYRRTMDFLREIEDNRYKDVEVDSIAIDIGTLPLIKEYRIKEIQLTKRDFKPGEKVKASIIIERYRESDTTINVDFKAPLSPCDLLVIASGRDEFLRYEKNRVPLNFQFDDFSEWKDFINTLPSHDRVVLSFYKKGSLIGTKEGELKDIPISLLSILKENDETSKHNFYLIDKKEVIFPGPVIGEDVKRIAVRR